MNPNSKANVLVIEDDQCIRQVIQELLELEGYDVKCAENGRVALSLLESEDYWPSIILLDLMMPVMDGWEFRRVQMADKRIAGIPVIVMTADIQADLNIAAISPDGLMHKPLEIDGFLETLGSLVARNGKCNTETLLQSESNV